MTLSVGPDAWIPHRLPDAEAAWNRFCGEIPSGTPAPARIEVYTKDGIGDSNVAITEPEPGCEDFWIVLGSRFFDGPTQEQQTLTLLHECLHVQLHAGPLKDRTEQGLVINEQNWPPPPGPNERFLGDRFAIACIYRSFADEVLAEQLLKRDFREWFARRWTYYLEMRRRSFTGRGFDRVHEDVRDFALGYEFLRLSMGERLADDPTQRSEFSTMAEHIWQELDARYIRGGRTGGRDRLRETCLRILALDLRTGPAYDCSAFDEAFDWIMAIPKPPVIGSFSVS